MASPCVRRFVSTSAEATAALAEQLGRAVVAGTVLALDGDLGAGKTTFVQGLARGLEVDGDVDSPTFTLMKEYSGRLPLFHFDAWMQGRERAFLESGGEDLLFANGVAVIEWGSRIADLLPAPRLSLALSHQGPTRRGLRFELVPGDGAERLWRAVAELDRSGIDGIDEVAPTATPAPGEAP